MKKLLFIITIILSLFVLISCNNQEKLNIDCIIDNENCILTKIISKEDDISSRLIIDDNSIILEKLEEIITYEYYVYEDNQIYCYYNFNRDYKNVNGMTKKKLDVDKYGIGNDFYKLKKLIQLAFIYSNIEESLPLIEDLYKSVINNNEITATFVNDSSFYDNILKYYNSIFPKFSKDIRNYSLNDYYFTLKNNRFEKVIYSNSKVNIWINKTELESYDISNLNSYWEFQSDEIITKLATTNKDIFVSLENDIDYTYFNSSYIAGDKIRNIYIQDDIEKLKIKEYKSTIECKKAYDAFMNYYALDDMYFAYKDECLYMTNVSNEKSSYNNLLNIEFKLSNKASSHTNSLADNIVYKLKFKTQVLEEGKTELLMKNYQEYKNLIDKMNENNEELDLNKINNITEESFNDFNYIAITYNIQKEDILFTYFIKGIYLTNENLEINVSLDTYDLVETDTYYIMILKVDKNVEYNQVLFNFHYNSYYFLTPVTNFIDLPNLND